MLKSFKKEGENLATSLSLFIFAVKIRRWSYVVMTSVRKERKGPGEKTDAPMRTKNKACARCSGDQDFPTRLEARMYRIGG